MRTEPIVQYSYELRNCSCLWDLDQLVGEVGWDYEDLKVVTKDQTFETQGCWLKRELRDRYPHGSDDPNRFIVSISLA